MELRRRNANLCPPFFFPFIRPFETPFSAAGVTLSSQELGEVAAAFGTEAVDYDALLRAILA